MSSTLSITWSFCLILGVGFFNKTKKTTNNNNESQMSEIRNSPRKREKVTTTFTTHTQSDTSIALM